MRAGEPMGVEVLDSKRVQHVASGRVDLALCGDEYVARDLFWDTTFRLHCRACLTALTTETAEQSNSPAAGSGRRQEGMRAIDRLYAQHIGNPRGRIALWLDETEAIELAEHFGRNDSAYDELMEAVERAYPAAEQGAEE